MHELLNKSVSFWIVVVAVVYQHHIIKKGQDRNEIWSIFMMFLWSWLSQNWKYIWQTYTQFLHKLFWHASRPFVSFFALKPQFSLTPCRDKMSNHILQLHTKYLKFNLLAMNQGLHILFALLSYVVLVTTNVCSWCFYILF